MPANSFNQLFLDIGVSIDPETIQILNHMNNPHLVDCFLHRDLDLSGINSILLCQCIIEHDIEPINLQGINLEKLLLVALKYEKLEVIRYLVDSP